MFISSGSQSHSLKEQRVNGTPVRTRACLERVSSGQWLVSPGDRGPGTTVGLTEAQSPWLQGTWCRRPAPGQAGFSAIDRVPGTNLSADRVGNPGPTLTVPEDPVGALSADFSPSARGLGTELAFAGFWRSPRASPRELQRLAPERGP